MTKLTYNEDKIASGLAALLACAGSPSKASEALKAQGITIPASTLSRWKNHEHAERYRQLEVDHGRELEAEIVMGARITARRAAEIEAELLERARTASDRDVPRALSAVTDVKSKSVNEVLALTGRPTDGGRKGRDMGELLKFLVDKKVFTVVDATAEEEPPAKSELGP